MRYVQAPRFDCFFFAEWLIYTHFFLFSFVFFNAVFAARVYVIRTE